MALTYNEINAVTNDYFKADGGKAVDIYFEDSFLMNHLMLQKKGLWERPNGGYQIRIPLSYATQNGGSYDKTSTLSSDDVESINAAVFGWKYYYSNATIHRIDEQKNKGPYAEVQLITTKVMQAQQKIREDLATDMYALAADSAKELSGLLSLVSETTTTAYGGIQGSDMAKWEGKTTTDSEAISLAVLRALRSKAKIGSGANGKPDIGVTTEDLFNVVSGILQVQQRFTEDKDTAKAGFQHLVFEGMIISADDYCPSGDFFALNSKHIGFAIDKEGYFARDPWGSLTANGVPAKTMKIFWDGNLICNNRKAHAAHTNLS